MEKTLKVINRMVADGVIEQYAIGGAIAAIFYVEPFSTQDIDVFFALSGSTSSLLILEPIYQYLAGKGYQAQGEAIEIEDWPVLFLPVFNPLLAEAVAQADEIKFKRTPTRVIRAEHLVAIMLQTGRVKDYARIVQFLAQGAVDLNALEDVLARHRLLTKWRAFARKFL